MFSAFVGRIYCVYLELYRLVYQRIVRLYSVAGAVGFPLRCQ